MDECNLIHLESEESALGLIDFSSENDSLVLDDESLSRHNNLLSEEHWKDPKSIDLFHSMNDDKEAVTVESIDHIEQSSVPNDSSEPDNRVRRKGKCNLRKSLAWDRAFFSSAGVLDLEELSGMIGESEMSKNQILSSIIEDVGESIDSISTLGSENLTTDNFETELFEDIRASVQKSIKKLDVSVYKEASKKSPVLPPGRKTVPTTQNQVKLKIGSKKPDVISKAIPKQNLKTWKQDSSLSEVTKSVKVKDSTTITGNSRSISTHSNKLKTNSGSSISARRTTLLPKPTQSSSVSLSTGSTRSSSDSFGRKVMEKSAVNKRTGSAYLKSSKISSGVSPASSTTINGKLNNLRTSFNAGTCQPLDHPSDHMSDVCDQISFTKPSGLRMPSPTIGFFDGAKSVQTSNGSGQPKVGKAKYINTKSKIGKHLNTQITNKVNGHSNESNGSTDVIDSETRDSKHEKKESWVI